MSGGGNGSGSGSGNGWAFVSEGRRGPAARAVDERLGDWREVYRGDEETADLRAQASRCMDCGVPFCHTGTTLPVNSPFASGCPINNLIPELGPSGELVVSSTFTGSLPLAGVTEVSSNGGSSAAALLLKHDPAGNLLWSRSFPVLTQSTYGYRAVVAPNDDVVLVGEHRETVDMGDKLLTFVGQGDGFVVRMQP